MARVYTNWHAPTIRENPAPASLTRPNRWKFAFYFSAALPFPGEISALKPISLLLLTVLAFGAASCRSSGKKKETAETRETSRLGAAKPGAQLGGYYKLKRSMNGFYNNVPIFTQVLPDRYLMRGHIIQLLILRLPAAGRG